jgi:uncharacterized protein YukJ
MRSPNLVLFLILLNFAAIVMSGAGVVDVGISTGSEDVINSVQDTAIENRTQEQPAQDEIVGAFFDAGNLIQDIARIAFAGPFMLQRLGVPALITNGFITVVAFVVAFDIAEAITGRRFS